jgi:hypothetical protein
MFKNFLFYLHALFLSRFFFLCVFFQKKRDQKHEAKKIARIFFIFIEFKRF